MATARLFRLLAASAALSLVACLNILVTNDDSWASANIRATFDALVKDGHNVVLVGPAVQQSGTGGTFVLPSTPNMTVPGEFGTIPVGAPIFGNNASEPRLWYFDGSPAASAIFGIDVIAPMVFGSNTSIDLVVSGPNEGNNNGPFLYTLSGTIGATYSSVERGIPGIAFSAGNGTHRSYTTNTGLPSDPANQAAQVVSRLVKALAAGVNTKKQRLLPLGVGLNANLPVFGPTSNCTNPPFVLTRLTGGANIDKLTLNTTTGLPQSSNIAAPGLNTAINGNTRLPGETPTSAMCDTAVSVFSVDYDAPSNVAGPIQAHLANNFNKH